MGVSLIQSVLELTMIKLTLLASFGSSTGLDPITQGLDPVTQGHVVKRSADADAFYAGYGYPYSYGYVPFGSSTGLDPITQGLDPATQGYLPYGYYHHY